jgi:hypothetical protein
MESYVLMIMCKGRGPSGQLSRATKFPSLLGPLTNGFSLSST